MQTFKYIRIRESGEFLPRGRFSAEYKESTQFSVNYAEFACLSWSQNELREIRVIRDLAQYSPCLKER